MEGDANTKTLRQLTKRERKSGKRNDAIKAAAKGEQEVEKSTTKMSLPGAEYLKKLTTTTAINVMAFGVACLAIYKYGDQVADYIESYVPSEKALLDALKAQQEQMMAMQGAPMM